jgi:tripartite-type tricarboxylate transporter receptor subunit TctC
MDQPAVAERFRGLGASPGASSSAEFAARIRTELEQWQTLAKQAQLKFD